MPNCKCGHPRWAHFPNCEAVVGYKDVREEFSGNVYVWTGEPMGDCDCKEFVQKKWTRNTLKFGRPI